MQNFIELFNQLDQTTSTLGKEIALRNYFAKVNHADAAWAVYFLSGGTPRRLVKVNILRKLIEFSPSLPEWLFEESYQAVGDLAETIALLLPRSATDTNDSLSDWVELKLLPLRDMDPEQQPAYLLPLLFKLDVVGKMICLKLITGNFRVGVSRSSVTKALAAYSGLDSKLIAQRLVGFTHINGQPGAADFQALIANQNNDTDVLSSGSPYPFFLAHPLQLGSRQLPEHIGQANEWQAEWKWDGIRVQIVKRNGEIWIWSRGEELITERFPEIAELKEKLPDGCVIDGEIVVWQNGKPQSFQLLQKRIGRLKVGAKLLKEAPTIVVAFDLLEFENADYRRYSLSQRLAKLSLLIDQIHSNRLILSPVVEFNDWQHLAILRAESRERGVEGIMLKQKNSHYGVGRTKDTGVWWKWKIDPMTVDAVLIYAQRGQGRRASLYTDYTFAVWDKPLSEPDRQLLPFAKAYSGLTDAELKETDEIIKRTTLERFGPVATLEPSQVFEIGFEGIAYSSRHKSGISVRFPRILRWRHDKPIEGADTLESLRQLLG
jgi:DNA ligase 1